MKMIGELLAREEINAAAVLALSGTLVVLVAKGDGSLSLKRMVSALLSNPIPRLEPTTGARDINVSLQAAGLRFAA